jgi:hypothetical protein
MLPACGVGECRSKFYITDNFGQISRNKTSRTGWTVGGGAEWQFLPHWSVFLEYDYLASNETRASPVGPSICGNDVFTTKANLQTVLLGGCLCGFRRSLARLDIGSRPRFFRTSLRRWDRIFCLCEPQK